MSSRFNAIVAAAAVGLTISWLIFLYAGLFADRTDANIRTLHFEHLGIEYVRARNALPDAGSNSIVLTPRRPDSYASASWDLPDYELRHVLADTQRCSAALYVLGSDVRANGKWSTIRYFVNDLQVDRAHAGLSAGDAATTRIFFSPLYQPVGMLMPLRGGCPVKSVRLRVDANVRSTISRVGIIARYAPQLNRFGAWQLLTITGIAIVSLTLIVYGAAILAVTRTFGWLAAATSTLVACGAPLTHDQWDFSIWLRFIDLAAFGHGNPTLMWAGSPIWPLLTTAVSPVLVASSALAGLSSQDVSALFLKFVMAIALIATAFLAARWSTRGTGRRAFFLVLLSPLGLYVMGGGYREIFLGVFAVAGVELAMRGRHLIAIPLLVIAASISEAILPLIFLPAGLALISHDGPLRQLRAGALRAGFALALFAAEWLLFISKDFAAKAVTARTASYRFGGASWFGVLDDFGMLPRWVTDHSLLFVLGLFLILTIPLTVRLWRLSAKSVDARSVDVLSCFVGYVSAFFLSYRGVDPNTLYGLFIVFVCYFSKADRFREFPFVFSIAGGVLYYAILGIGDFVNWTFLHPVDSGIIGTLGRPVTAMVLLTTMLTIAAYLFTITPNLELIRLRTLPVYLTVFFAACIAAAVQQNAWDVAFALSAVATMVCVSTIFALEAVTSGESSLARIVPVAVSLGIIAIAVQRQTTAPALTGVLGLTVGTALGASLSDIALVISAAFLLLLQPGTTALASVGYDVMLIVLFVVSLARPVIDWRRRRSQLNSSIEPAN